MDEGTTFVTIAEDGSEELHHVLRFSSYGLHTYRRAKAFEIEQDPIDQVHQECGKPWEGFREGYDDTAAQRRMGSYRVAVMQQLDVDIPRDKGERED